MRAERRVAKSPSTAAPERLPDIAQLRRLTKSLAMLDAIICPEWEFRYYSYNSQWGEGEEMASMRDGCGDEWFLWVGREGAALKGFAHESPLAGDRSFATRIHQTVPSCFASFLNEPAFTMDRATFCIWRRRADSTWNVVSTTERTSVEDGSAELLGILDGRPETYLAWAADYYERAVAPEAVRALYHHQALTERLVRELNSDLTLSDIAADATEIGYPQEST
jgi:hypothetical protein